jgi:hypothetical protein
MEEGEEPAVTAPEAPPPEEAPPPAAEEPPAPPSPPPPAPAPSAPPPAASSGFALPTATRAAALSTTPEFTALLAQLLSLCGEPVTAVAAVADALARQHPTQCVATLAPFLPSIHLH